MAAESKGFEEGEGPCADVGTLAGDVRVDVGPPSGASGQIAWSDLPQEIRGLLVMGLPLAKQLRIVSPEALGRHPWSVMTMAVKNAPLPTQRMKDASPESNKWLNEAFKLALLKQSDNFVRAAIPFVDPTLRVPSELARFGLFAVLKRVLETGATAWTGDEAKKLIRGLYRCSSPDLWALVLKLIPDVMLDRPSLLASFRVAVGRGDLAVVKEVAHRLKPTSLEWAALLTTLPIAMNGVRQSGSTDILVHALKGVGDEAFDWDFMMCFVVRNDMKGAAELLVPFYKTAGGTPKGIDRARKLGDLFGFKWATSVLERV